MHNMNMTKQAERLQRVTNNSFIEMSCIKANARVHGTLTCDL